MIISSIKLISTTKKSEYLIILFEIHLYWISEWIYKIKFLNANLLF